MRKPIIAGNWKMNKTIAQTKEFVQGVLGKAERDDVEAVLCVPFTDLAAAKEAIGSANIKVGAQNMHFEDDGAYTGEVSADMLLELGVEYVILGHSERREYFAETDETVNAKTKKALAKGLIPIVCCGETLEEREAGSTMDKVKGQIVNGLAGLSQEQVAGLVIAYEPIWAIGTGKTATSDQANEVISYIRQVIREGFGDQAADGVRIQYGGSVKPDNVKEIMAQSDIDGALVGGASLVPDGFCALVNFKE